MGFLDTLSDLNRQNYGGGLANYGKSLRDLADNQQLVKGVNELKEKKRLFENEDLKTTSEQLAEVITDKNVSGENSLLKKATDASLNLVNVYDKIGAYQNLYQPFITSFATLGEDGVKVAATLSQELGDKVANLEKKGFAPMKELEFERIKQEWSSNDLQLRIASENYQNKKDISKVAEYMMDNDLMLHIPGGKITSYNRGEWVKFNAARKAVIDDAKKQFGDLSDNVIGPAFELAQQYLGNEFHFIEKPPEDGSMSASMQYEMIGLPQDLMFMQQMSYKWNNLTDETRQLLKKHMKDPNNTEISDNNQLGKEVLELANIFDANGAYQQAYLRAKSFLKGTKGIDFDKYSKKKIDTGDGYYDVTFVDNYTDIIRPYGPSAFANETFIYNDATTKKVKEKLKLSIDKLNSKNSFEGYSDDVFSQLSRMMPGAGSAMYIDYGKNNNKQDNNQQLEKLKETQRLLDGKN